MHKAEFSTKPLAQIEDWYITTVRGERVLVGAIQGHPNQQSFRQLYQITTPIVAENEADGWIETRNTRYMLGKPAEMTLTPRAAHV